MSRTKNKRKSIMICRRQKGLDVNILTIFVFSNIFSLLVFQVTSSLNSTLYRIVKKKINTNLSNLRYSLWLLKCCKNTFLYSLIFYLKNYIYLYSMKKKKFLSCKHFVIQRKYIDIQSKRICI